MPVFYGSNLRDWLSETDFDDVFYRFDHSKIVVQDVTLAQVMDQIWFT